MILGLDMATKKTGYCVMSKSGDLKAFGVLRTDGLDIRERIKQLYIKIKDLIINNNIKHIVFEDVPITNHNNLKTGKDLCILQGAILSLCFENDVNFTFYAPSSWRSKIGLYDGTRLGMKREIQKNKAIEKVNNMFDLNLVYYANETKTHQTDDDKAEAICLVLAYLKDCSEK